VCIELMVRMVSVIYMMVKLIYWFSGMFLLSRVMLMSSCSIGVMNCSRLIVIRGICCVDVVNSSSGSVVVILVEVSSSLCYGVCVVIVLWLVISS